MLKVISGSHYEKAQDELARLKTKSRGREVRYFEEGALDHVQIEELVAGGGMFNEQYLVIIENGMQQAENQSFFVAMLGDMRISDTLFVFMEQVLLAAQKKKFKPEEITDVGKIEKKEEFNLFAITDTVGNRDRKNGWLILQKAYDGGVEAEHVIGLLWWAVKNMLLVSKSETNPGLKPFVYNKTKQQAKRYTLTELEHLAYTLVAYRYRARTGSELPLLLERWVLEL
ncbi:MAG: hypothetical protein ACI83D_000634 [Planctomycetota bacterium]|jgi:hypothetical protein